METLFAPFPTWEPLDSGDGEFRASLAGSISSVRVSDRALLTIALERLDADGQRIEFGTEPDLSIALTPARQSPTPEDWEGVTVASRDTYVGLHPQTRVLFTLVPGEIPGVTTLVAGREYSVWIQILLGDFEQVLLAGILQAR